ncbi:LacI family DNA-binding transcriptional regulator [Vagococcus humatus]|uniref:Phage tail protein n=1 Tax=Vagococcus humatus TaxID=1889241 RepID=A0A3R9ZX03_9ENTE|nr:LacI family DNA-binding transcriptional regulator [Vagococcus humatus]RST89698.1 phage tail protein [Vagococcus humatus]
MPTMNDVAKLAGVSRGTVSNYVNGVQVKEASQKKIQAAIDELNYVPNITARQLKLQRSNLVVFILPTTRTPFFSELVYGMQQALNQVGFKMLLCNSNNQIEEELDYIQMAKEQKVAGIITISYSELGPYLTTDVPIVSIEKRLAPHIPCISSDNYAGGQLAARLLHKKQAKNFLVITRTTSKSLVNYGVRVQGFMDYCEKNDISVTKFESYQHEENFYPELRQFLETQYQQTCLYDGIFAVADQYADFSVGILKQLGYDVPADIQIIGFDGGRMYPEQPAYLSSIRQPVSDIIKQCVSILQQSLEHPNQKTVDPILLPVSYLEGLTTR